jgi:hypothetical protein
MYKSLTWQSVICPRKSSSSSEIKDPLLKGLDYMRQYVCNSTRTLFRTCSMTISNASLGFAPLCSSYQQNQQTANGEDQAVSPHWLPSRRSLFTLPHSTKSSRLIRQLPHCSVCSTYLTNIVHTSSNTDTPHVSFCFVPQFKYRT